MEFDATFLISVISFIVFVFIMNKIFYAPVLKILQERQNYVSENFKSASATRNEYTKQTKYHDDELENTRDNARSYISEKSKSLKKESSEIIGQYKNELYENIFKEKENLRQSAIEAKDVLKEKVVDIAKDISLKILGNDINNGTIDKSQIEE